MKILQLKPSTAKIYYVKCCCKNNDKKS